MGLFSFFKGKPADFEEGKRAREAFLENVELDDVAKEFNVASGLMLDRKFPECIAEYERLAAKYPTRAAQCLSQIGAARFFLGEYDAAIFAYVKAREGGEDEEMMDDNLWEACEKAAEVTGRRQEYGRRYLDLSPNGRYRKQALKLT
jgi:hypothetical protein